MTATADHVSITVIDCPAYAWRNVAESVKDTWYSQLDEDFVHDYRAQLDTAATQTRPDGTSLYGAELTKAWNAAGYQVSLDGEDGLAHQRRPHGFPWGQVWDTACTNLDPHALVVAAGLDDVLLRYAAAHPRTEHLARHCAALRRCTAGLRAELHARLDLVLATNATCDRAEHQVDGWRSLVDTANGTQLDYLAIQIPA